MSSLVFIRVSPLRVLRHIYRLLFFPFKAELSETLAEGPVKAPSDLTSVAPEWRFPFLFMQTHSFTVIKMK